MTSLLELIQSRPPIPPQLPERRPIAIPTPNEPPISVPPLALLTRPEPPPPAPQQPLDESVIRRHLALAGEAPTDPTGFPYRPKNTYEAITGGITVALDELFGGGSLRQRHGKQLADYKQELADYTQKRQQLGLLGLQSAMLEASRAREMKEQMAQRLFEQDLKDRADRTKDFLIQRREQIQREAEERRQQAKERGQQLRDARQFAAKFWLEGTPPQIAHEIGEYVSGLRDDVTPEALKWATAKSRLAEQKLGRLRTTGSGVPTTTAAQKALDNFNAAKDAVIAAVQRGDVRAERMHRRRLDAAYGALNRFQNQIERGMDSTGQWPYAKLRSGSSPTTAQQPQKQMNFDLTQPQAPALNEQQRDLFNRIKQQQPGASDSQIYEYMRKKGWLQ